MDLTVETPARCTVYRRRRPEHTPPYRAMHGHLETYLALAREGHNDGEGVPQYVEGGFRRYLECGHDFLIAFSCKGRRAVPLVQPPAHGPRSPSARRVAGPPSGSTRRVLNLLPMRCDLRLVVP